MWKLKISKTKSRWESWKILMMKVVLSWFYRSRKYCSDNSLKKIAYLFILQIFSKHTSKGLVESLRQIKWDGRGKQCGDRLIWHLQHHIPLPRICKAKQRGLSPWHLGLEAASGVETREEWNLTEKSSKRFVHRLWRKWVKAKFSRRDQCAGGWKESVGTGNQKVDAEEAEHRKIGKLVLFYLLRDPSWCYISTCVWLK